MACKWKSNQSEHVPVARDRALTKHITDAVVNHNKDRCIHNFSSLIRDLITGLHVTSDVYGLRNVASIQGGISLATRLCPCYPYVHTTTRNCTSEYGKLCFCMSKTRQSHEEQTVDGKLELIVLALFLLWLSIEYRSRLVKIHLCKDELGERQTMEQSEYYTNFKIWPSIIREPKDHSPPPSP